MSFDINENILISHLLRKVNWGNKVSKNSKMAKIVIKGTDSTEMNYLLKIENFSEDQNDVRVDKKWTNSITMYHYSKEVTFLDKVQNQFDLNSLTCRGIFLA